MRILIKNGTVVNSSESIAADVLTEDDRISAVGHGLPAREAERVINAEGMYILPGGIDPHVHMHLPSAAGYSSDDFFTGSHAALYGGTTTIIDFVTAMRGESLTEAFEKRMTEAESCLADYSFHVSPVEWRQTLPDEIKGCVSEGVTSFKVYMAYKDTIGLSDDDLLKVMKAVSEAGGIVTIHCEDGNAIEKLRTKYFNEGNISPLYHALSRPSLMEAQAVKKAITFAAEAACPLYVVHVSSEKSLEYIREARLKNQTVYSETCPQYLLLDESKYEGNFSQTAPYVMSPPLRTKADNAALWKGISEGTISSAGTDHCPFTMAQKMTGKEDFRKIPGGAGGVEHRLSLLYTYGVLTGQLNFNQLVKIFANGPARIFSLYPRKGEIRSGCDADIVIWNPQPEKTISAETHHQNCDINIYEGIKVRGNADYVIRGGEIIIENGRMTGSNKPGKFLHRPV
jgi:dihydropyrimidinase